MEQQVQKSRAVTDIVLQSALQVMREFKGLPKYGKRYTFHKTYNRRPMNKKRLWQVIAKVAINSAIASSQIGIILSTPINRNAK